MTVLLDGDTWTTAAWPLAFPVLAGLLALACLLVSILAPSGAGKPVVALNVLAGGILGCLVFGAVPMSVLSDGTQPSMADLFADLVRGEAWATVGAAAVTLLAAVVWLARPVAGGTPFVRIGLAAASLAFVGLTDLHTLWLATVPVPELTATLPPRVHLGRAVTVTATLSNARWSADPVTTTFARTGPAELTVTATHPGFALSRRLTTIVGEDRADPLDTPHVGDWWLYGVTTRREDHLLWVIPSRGTWEGPRTRVRIAGERELLGRHVYDVEIASIAEEGTVERRVIYAWDGQVLVDGEGEPTTWIDREDVVASDGTVGCSTAIFPSATCSCATRPHDGILLPGPARCSWTGSGSMLVTAFLAIVTAGLVITDPNPTYEAVLLESGSAP